MNLVRFGVTITCPSWRITSLNADVSGAAAPDAFGPFRVLHQIGAGALGPVFRAYEPDRDRLAAVKLFRLDLPPERAHLLAGELDRLTGAGLGHVSVAAPLAAGITVASVYFVQEFVAGESLDVALRAGPLGLPGTLRIVDAVAAALDHAGGAGVMHGALHPRDVLVSAGEVRLTGLGVAKALERAGAVAPVRRPYAPPERAAGVGWDRRCDVFSLAATACEMLWSRRVVATGEQAARLLTPLPGGDITALRRVFARALAAEPAERFETASAFAEALRHAAGERAETSAALPFVRRERRPRTAAADEPRLPLDVQARPEQGPDESRPAAASAVAQPPAGSQPSGVPSLLAPLGLAALVFLAVGFAIGYGVAGRQMVIAPVPAPGVVSAGAVASPALPDPEPVTPPAEPEPAAAALAASPVARGEIAAPAGSPAAPPGPSAAPPAPSAAPAPPGAGPVSVARQPPSSPAPPMPAARSGAAAAGTLQVVSRPSGARVYLDGWLAGTTPLDLGGVRTGERAVHLELDGYRRWTTGVDVAAGGRHRVAASLDRLE